MTPETARTATLCRKTRETNVEIHLNLDGVGQSDCVLGIPFLEHMLEQVARHGLMDLNVRAQGDIEVDDHHTVEDVGIVLGQAIARALGDKRGITRYGHACIPLDEVLSRVVVDFSGRPGSYWHVDFGQARVGRFDVELFPEFFRGFANGAGATLHLENLHGGNSHHVAESLFKAFGRAIKMAVAIDPRDPGTVPSTKGVL